MEHKVAGNTRSFKIKGTNVKKKMILELPETVDETNLTPTKGDKRYLYKTVREQR